MAIFVIIFCTKEMTRADSSPAMLLLPHALHCSTLGVGDPHLNPLHSGCLVPDVRERQARGIKDDHGHISRSEEGSRAAIAIGARRQFAEQLAPYLPDYPFSPTEAKFIGAPINFLVFKGMDAQYFEEVIFVEMKSGSARLNKNEHSLKDAIINKRVRRHEYHVPTPISELHDSTTVAGI
jgi:hypothetical protein